MFEERRKPAGVLFFTGLGVITALLVLGWSWNRESVQAFKESAGPLAFFIAMALLTAVGIPLTPFLLAAGASFGVGKGLVGSLAAIAVNLAGCYLIAQRALQPRVARMIERLGYSAPELGRDRGLRVTLLVKMTPGLPWFAKNFFLGAAGVPFATYFAVSMLASGAYAFALIVLGEAIFAHDLSRGAIVLLAIALATSAVWFFRRRSKLRMERASQAVGS